MIFVTGASGFIGKYVIRALLNRNCDVLALTRDKEKYQKQGTEEVIEGDLVHIEDLMLQLRGRKIDSVVHLAWEGIPDYGFEMSKKNLIMGMNVLSLCKECQVDKLIVTGSCWEYYKPNGKISTNDQLGCENSFQAAKTSLYRMMHAFCTENQICLNWFRLFYVYGPGQREGSLIPYIIKSFIQKECPKLNGAYNENDFVYVEDVAEAIVKVSCEEVETEVINIGTGQSVRVLDIVRKVAKEYDIDFDEESYQQCSSTCFYADSEEIENSLHWVPKIMIDEGLRKIINDNQ